MKSATTLNTANNDRCGMDSKLLANPRNHRAEVREQRSEAGSGRRDALPGLQ